MTQNCIVLVNSVCSVCWLEGPTQSPLESSLDTDDSVKLFSVSVLSSDSLSENKSVSFITAYTIIAMVAAW